MMYEVLIKHLRDCAKADPIENTFKEAADAIEELSRRIDQAVDMYNRDIEKAAMYEVLIGSSPEPPDVVEQRTGKWETVICDDGYGAYNLYKCDQCGDLSAQPRNYCRECGARMVSDEKRKVRV